MVVLDVVADVGMWVAGEVEPIGVVDEGAEEGDEDRARRQ
jgi:hypothetical protein